MSIQQVTEAMGVTAHTLRYYEKIGLLPSIERDASGYRRYTEEDLNWLKFITKLRESNMPIRDILQYGALIKEGNHTRAARKELLQQHKEYIEQQMALLQVGLEIVNEKIMYYQEKEKGDQGLCQT
ncbi:MerR family transcriptional regulator [Fictibacillus macauensis]|uniref:MerR family transcriptional regulator n=1 Tax=Fictibacillus macauensis TaxID=245160 RepID=UPI00138A6749|nr:MerR family transcriptional regulator [Fictibacillus macauensis]